MSAEPIDAVITWVDGAAPEHLIARAHWMGLAGELHENARNPHRWGTSDEILYCLQSIENNAPWLRTIWIVTAGERPDLDRLSAALRDKIRFVSHARIFAGFDDALPTFNSLAIESLLWRIEGLAERFLYFNDDVFLTAPLSPRDMFEGERTVLRGSWRDYAHMVGNLAGQADPATFHRYLQINAAGLEGFGPERVFVAAHVVHPMRRSVMAALFVRHEAAFAQNVAHRFRDLAQFLPQALYNHACLRAGHAVLRDENDHLHIHSGQGSGDAPERTRELLDTAEQADLRFLCVNDLPQLEALVPELRHWLARRIGGFPGHAVVPRGNRVSSSN